MADVPGSRLEGGLWCHEVLEHLEAYVAGTLPAEARAAAEAHLAACDRCASFGGVYAGLVRALHARLSRPEPVSGDVAARLDRHLEQITASTDE